MFGIGKTNKNNKGNGEPCSSGNEQTNRRKDISRHYDSLQSDKVMETAEGICRFFNSLHERLAQLEMQLSRVSESRQDDLAMIETCVKTTADCQKQAAELANQYIERHALHPAVLTVDTLTEVIIQMSRQANTFLHNQDLDPSLTPLLRSIVDAAEIAESKRQQLDIISIRPEESDELDGDRHEIVTAAATNDNDKHRKIHKTVTAGLIYRGKILRRARVSVYRFNKEDIAAQQDRRQECQLLDREREKK